MSRAFKDILLWPEHMAVSTYRLAYKLRQGGRIGSILAQILYRLNLIINGCDIVPIAKIGAGLKLPHPIGVVIGGTEIGKNAHIYQNVTIGSRSQEGGGMPTIGDNVTIYAGAVVVGKIYIGDGAVIGANSVVLSDVLPSTLVVGIPARSAK